MAIKNWWESFSASDCLKIGSWEDMTDYIQHSACTNFTIYSECTTGEQAFRFTNNGTLSMLIGGADSGDDLGIYANDTDLCASIKLFGNGNITSKIKWDSEFEVSTCSDEELLVVSSTALTYKGTDICLAPCGGGSSCPVKGGTDFILYSDCAGETGQVFKFAVSGSNSQVFGSTISGRDLTIYPNTIDSFPKIELNGGSTLAFYIDNDDVIQFIEDGMQLFKFDRVDAVTSGLYGSGNDTHKLRVYANSNNAFPFLELIGSGNIRVQLEGGDDFVIMTGGNDFFTFNTAGIISYMKGGASNGDTMEIVANNADGNGEIFLNTGTAVVKFGTHTSLGAESLSGFITVKDAAGNTRKLAVVS